MYRHILVPTDGSPLSRKAVKAAVGLARRLGARITAVYVIPSYAPPAYGGDTMLLYSEYFSPEEYKTHTQKHARAALAKVEAVARAAEVPCAALFVTGNEPWKSIIRTARSRRCDLIVMASHGRRGLAALLLGSETTKVLTHSRTPVLVCR
jgi:nucleotide-binding universal stress UspA family protein